MPSLQSYLLRYLMRRQADRGTRVSVAEFRAAFHQRSIRQERIAPGVRVETVDVGGCTAEWLVAPGAADGPTLLHLHGGAYVFASARTHRGFVSQIVAHTGGRALVLDYRLAPEHPYPAALDDALAAYRWLLARPAPAARIALAGESAGAGLALATMLRARSEGLPLPAGAALVSPWVDLTHREAPHTEHAHRDVMLRGEQLAAWADLYAPGRDRQDPYISPVFADLRGLPPLWMCADRDELLYPETLRLAERARQAGIPVELEIGEGLLHVWPFFHAILPEGRKTITRLADFLRRQAATPAG